VNLERRPEGRLVLVNVLSVNLIRLCIVAAVVLASIATAVAASPESPVGAASCSGCHPAKPGVENAVPRLTGRNPEGIVAQMRAFRSGQRAATVMDRIAKGYSDAEVEAIAAWYAAQQ
jgi:cytochrome subunit of sulfide dehydrogenase